MDLAATAATPPERRPRSYLQATEDWYERDEDGNWRLRELTEEQFEQIEETQELLQQSNKTQIYAASTHKTMDRHLIEFRSAMILRYTMFGGEAELITYDRQSDANDHLFFPNNRPQMWENLKWYMIHVCPSLVPLRLRDRGKGVHLSTLFGRRSSIQYFMDLNMEDPPPRWLTHKKTLHGVYTAAKKYGLRPSQFKGKYFGKPELLHLIDEDMEASDYIEVAEQHHLAWTIGMVCGVRPSSIGASVEHPDNYLRWEHISFQRDPADRSRISTAITFKFLKGYQDYRSGQPLEMTVAAPNNPNNIAVCPTYRLLTIAIRRGVLQDYTTYQSMLEGQDVFIKIKPAHLRDPLIYAAKPGGKRLDFTKPMKRDSFSPYLSRVAIAAGYGPDVTLYAFRRQAGTLVALAEGADRARAFLNHNPGSTTFEEHYYNQMYDLDVGRIAYDEDYAAGAQELRDSSHPVLYRASLQLSNSEQQRQVEAFVQKYTDPDAQFPKLERKRVRYWAKQSLVDMMQQMSKDTLTIQELQKRRDELKQPSKLTQAMYKLVEADLAKARQGSVAPTEGMPDATLDDDEAADVDDDVVQMLEEPEDERVRFQRDVLEQLGDVEYDSADEETVDQVDTLPDEVSPEAADAAVQESSIQKTALALQAPCPRTGEGTFYDNLADAKILAAGQKLRYNNGDFSLLYNQFPAPIQDDWLQFLRKAFEHVKTWAESQRKNDIRIQVEGALNTLSKLRSRFKFSVSVEGIAERIPDIPFPPAVGAFFKLMLDRKDLLPGEPRQCDECLGDDTMPDDLRYRWYESRSRIERHFQSNPHSPYETWKRKIEILAKENLEKNPNSTTAYPCKGCGKGYKKFEGLRKHVDSLREQFLEKPNPKDKHYIYMMEENFFSTHWKKSRRDPTVRARTLKAEHKRQVDLGIRAPRIEEVQAVRPGVFNGAEVNLFTIGGPPPDQDGSKLRYPAALAALPYNSAASLKAACERAGIIDHFVSFGGDSLEEVAGIEQRAKEAGMDEPSTLRKF